MTTKKTPPRITPSYLENAALHYLERFATSRANLRRVLMRKIDRSVAHHGGERAEHLETVDAVLAKLARLGYLDDAAYAGQKVRSLHASGKGSRTIRATLAAKGVDAELASAALATLEDDHPEPDLAAAVKLARKRRLGPWRRGERDEFRQKDMAALARAGFDFDIARRVVLAETVEDIEDQLSS